MKDIVIAVASVVNVICAIVFGYATFNRNRKTDEEDDAKTTGTILTELGYIKGGIDDVKTEQREQRKTNMEVITRLTAVEASAKQAHKRIDAIVASMSNPP